ncbi:MAG TPA: DNA-binding transcriptional regulator [Tepidisphaeraceae bacterium]|nr:DNA-binding transcriptional regulator [Tepidisphaeraceae bacterium]
MALEARPVIAKPVSHPGETPPDSKKTRAKAHPASTARGSASRADDAPRLVGRRPPPVATRPGMRHVALLIETSGSYGRGLLRGVSKYNREHGGWSTYFHPHGLGDPPPPWLTNWKGDGILARIDTPEIAQLVLKSGVPVVNLRGTVGELPFPYVGPDHDQIAKLAAEHLLERGLRNFAFCGKPAGVHPGLDERGTTFEQVVSAAGGHCDVFPADSPSGGEDSWELEQERLSRWIRSLPKPVGVMACNDERGLQVLDACRRSGATVPDEVAVIGADNDEHLCDLSIPPLTSVDVNAEQIGYTAAALLDQMMQGKRSLVTSQRLAPRGIFTRLSTDTVASDDDEVNRGLRYIRENGCSGLRVVDVLAHMGMSRASLQQRLKRIIGRTIHEEIERVRLARVKELLLSPDMTIKQVARATGFSSVQYMTRVFRAALGETPARYRSRRNK